MTKRVCDYNDWLLEQLHKPGELSAYLKEALLREPDERPNDYILRLEDTIQTAIEVLNET